MPLPSVVLNWFLSFTSFTPNTQSCSLSRFRECTFQPMHIIQKIDVARTLRILQVSTHLVSPGLYFMQHQWTQCLLPKAQATRGEEPKQRRICESEGSIFSWRSTEGLCSGYVTFSADAQKVPLLSARVWYFTDPPWTWVHSSRWRGAAGVC